MLDRSNGKNESYMEFCYSFCQINEPFVDFAVRKILFSTCYYFSLNIGNFRNPTSVRNKASRRVYLVMIESNSHIRYRYSMAEI